MRAIVSALVVVLGSFALACGSEPADPIATPTNSTAPGAPASVESASGEVPGGTVGDVAQAALESSASAPLGGEVDGTADPSLREKGNNGVGNGLDPQPSIHAPINDGAGSSPGHPGAKH